MDYTLSGAAKATAKSKSTLHRAIKAGKLSAKRTEEGSYLIDAAELARAFPPTRLEPSPWDSAGQNDRPLEEAGTELAVLRVRAEMLEAQLQRERETVDDLRRRLDRAEERVLALMVTPVEASASNDQPTTTSVAIADVPNPSVPPPVLQRRGLLRRLLRRT